MQIRASQGSTGPVSSHYLVRDDPVRVYQLVHESRRAYHAGESAWAGHTNLNSASIGIEIVNAGNRLADQGQPWQDYPPKQIDAVVALVEDIVRRETFGHAVEAAHDQLQAARVMVEHEGGEADGGVRKRRQRLRARGHEEAVVDVLVERREHAPALVVFLAMVITFFAHQQQREPIGRPPPCDSKG